MKKFFLFIPVLAVTMSITGCIFDFSDDDSWKKEYGSPDLFLQTVLNGDYQTNVYLYENQNQSEDLNKEIANFISKLGPFEESTKKIDTVERYFTYEGFWQPATSGPNYCNMCIWDDGYIVINHKRSLGRLQSVYFSMDSSKALEAVDFVFNKINE